MIKNNRKQLTYFALLFLFFICFVTLCFYKIGFAGTHNWDEARHMVNAYEMYKNRNYLITTYLGQVDYYNLKPPLSMWCAVICFKLFGVDFAATRIPSAIAGVIAFVALNYFVLRHWGKKASIIFSALYVSNYNLIFFHMFRSADADGLFIMFFALAMICLYECETYPWLLFGWGFFLGMSFMAKCFHAVLGGIILVFYLPRIYKKLKWKHYLLGVSGGLLAILPWAIARLYYDGITFFYHMLMEEVVGRVEISKDYFAYARYYAKESMVLASILVAFLGFVLLRRTQREKQDILRPNKNFFLRDFVQSDLYLFVLWTIIPFVLFSYSGAYMQWYAYHSYLPLNILTAVILSKVFNIKGKRQYCGYILCFILFVPMVFTGWKSYLQLKNLKYNNNTYIREDLKNFIERNPEYRGCRAYIENNFNDYKERNQWEQNAVADISIIGDMYPVDGGVPMFLQDEDADSILILSKEHYDTYAEVLNGRYILMDGNEYLVFNHDFY